MKRISVIVPIYNVELYLERCIKSIINQTYTNLEIILINDGSKDRSLHICNKYKNIDKRIIVIDKENAGVSSARNKGLEIASGDYITFVDPDDWIESDMYESMCKDIEENNCDIVMCNYIIENNKNSIKVDLNLKNTILTDNNMIVKNIVSNMISPPTLNGKDKEIMASVWRLLIKSKVIRENNISFNEEIMVAEDLVFCIELFLNVSKVYIEDKYNYHYFFRNESAINSYNKDISYNFKILNEYILDTLKKHNLETTLKNRLSIRNFMCYHHIIRNLFKKRNDKKFQKTIEIIKRFCNDNDIQYLLNNQNISECKFSRAIYITLLKKKMYFLVYLYHNILNIYARIRNI